MVEPVSRAIEGQPQPFRTVQPLGKRISDALRCGRVRHLQPLGWHDQLFRELLVEGGRLILVRA
jgi:hypothetical protein